MASKPTHSKISKAKARLMMDHPFFATLLLRTPVHVTDVTPWGHPVQLACTDGSEHYYNPEFLDQCSVEDVMAVLAHEVGHDSLLHSLRMGLRNPDRWNRAGDHAINIMLEDQGFKSPAAVPGGWLADKQYKGWSADRIYDDLSRKEKDQKGGGGGQQGGGGKGQPSPQNGSGGKPGAPQAGKDWLHGDVLRAPDKSAAEQAAAEQHARQRVAAAANMARMAGKLKGDLERMVDEFLNPKVPWTDVLRTYMLRIVRARDNWCRRNRRFQSIYLPSRYSRKMGPIIFIPDTSGSMMGDDIEKICSEIAHCAAQTEPENIRVIWADAAVQGEQVFEANQFSYAALKPKGGGGTDMRVAISHAEKYNPQVVVLCTDAYTPWPKDPPPYPLIILCTTNHTCPYWAETIRI